ncbi:hypothetical protein KAR91_83525 [Candidatus Pacearchaeota archaeon]|nr:hypothetical protein [Candidatus Pacearchaeota archaeon]
MKKTYNNADFGIMGKTPEAPQAQAQPKEVPATPAQQQQRELFVTKGLQVLKQAGPSILEAINATDPIDGIAMETLKVIEKLESVALEAGDKLDPDVELWAANDIMGEMIRMYESAGGKQLSDEEKYQAFSLALSTYLDNAVKTGKVSPEELQHLGKMAMEGPGGEAIGAQVKESIGQGMGESAAVVAPQAPPTQTGIMG